MRVICRDRQKGKTTDLIAIAYENDYYMVCENKNMVDHAFSLSRDMKMPIRFPLTYREFLDKQYHGKGVKGFVIDNADILLQYLSPGAEVAAISVNQDWEDAE